MQIDMTPEGEFRTSPSPSFASRVARTALIVAILAGLLGAALLAIGFALAVIPVAVGAFAIAWITFRLQLWWARRHR